jgi:hypothetical protein
VGTRSGLLEAAVLGGQPGTGGGASYSTEALAIFAAFTTPPTTTRKGLIDTCVVALKTAGIWALLDVLYVFAAADSQAALINWKNPGTFNGTLVNSPSFTTDVGFTGASTKYVDSTFNPSTASSPQFVQDSCSTGVWSNTAAAVANVAAGYKTISAKTFIYPRSSSTTFFGVGDGGSYSVSVSSSDGSGLFVANRPDVTHEQGYRNGSLVASDSPVNSTAVQNSTLTFLAGDNTTNWAGQALAGTISASLDAAKQASLYSALHAYLQTVAGIA